MPLANSKATVYDIKDRPWRSEDLLVDFQALSILCGASAAAWPRQSVDDTADLFDEGSEGVALTTDNSCDLLKLCGAKGIRTPDLLDANETRYQLRHSPLTASRLPV